MEAPNPTTFEQPHDVIHVVPALFLDLDGTVRHSKKDPDGFIAGPDDIALYDDVMVMLRKFTREGYLIFGITNQGGVAHGFKTVEQVEAENRRTAELTASEDEPDGLFHGIFYCPFDPKGRIEPFNRRSLSRKPGVGMLVQAEEFARGAFGVVIDYSRSLFVGDREEDRLCAQHAGIPFFWANDFFRRNPVV